MRSTLTAVLVVLALVVLALVAGAASGQDAAGPASDTPVLRPAGDRGPTGDWPGVAAPEANEALPRLSPAGRLAFSVLVGARRFTSDAIYESGQTPEEVEALRILHREPNARQAFTALSRNGTAPGRLFGLCGLWYWDNAVFHRQVAALLRDHGDLEVDVQRGCSSFRQRVRDIVRLPEAGRTAGRVAVQLEDRSQTCKEWFANQPEGISGQYDIVGGGWPCVLRSGGGW